MAASSRAATTKSLYGSLARKHLEAGTIGTKRLDRLKPSDVESMIVKLRGDRLADSTVRQVYTVLRQALDVGVRDGLLATNPVAKVKRPGVARQEARYLAAADVARLLDAAKPLRYHVGACLTRKSLERMKHVSPTGRVTDPISVICPGWPCVKSTNSAA